MSETPWQEEARAAAMAWQETVRATAARIYEELKEDEVSSQHLATLGRDPVPYLGPRPSGRH